MSHNVQFVNALSGQELIVNVPEGHHVIDSEGKIVGAGVFKLKVVPSKCNNF